MEVRVVFLEDDFVAIFIESYDPVSALICISVIVIDLSAGNVSRKFGIRFFMLEEWVVIFLFGFWMGLTVGRTCR